MSINDSIIAGVGRPNTYATAMRISVRGPYNTLVVVHLRDAGLLPGIQYNDCKTTRNFLSYPSTFILQGFDQRFPPDFRHSTMGFLSYIGSGNDASVVYAIDEVTAHFDEVGRYYVDYHVAMLNDCQISAGSCSLSSWLPVNEPLPETHPAPMSSTTMRQSLELGNRRGYAVGIASLRKMLKEHDCDCGESS